MITTFVHSDGYNTERENVGYGRLGIPEHQQEESTTVRIVFTYAIYSYRCQTSRMRCALV
jgi:hypothetical protein